MRKEKIGIVNAAMEECLPMLKEVAKANDDAEIKIAVLSFSSGCEWITPESGPVSLEDYIWNDLSADGITDFGAALLELDSKLSRNQYLKSATGTYAPVIILISDGAPTDNWKKGLETIQKNNWFKFAIKIAIDIQSDRSVLEAFTGHKEAILDAKSGAMLKKMIHKVSIRASEFQSHSKQTEKNQSSAEEDSADLVKSVINEIDEEQNVESLDNSEWGKW